MTSPVEVSPALLRDRPLPRVGGTADKASRGTVLVIGGSEETPGAVLLAGVAALRVGAGKLQLATSAAAAATLAIAVPEARVVGLPAGCHPESAEAVARLAGSADAVLVGTGTLDAGAAGALVSALVPSLGPETALVLDAGAIQVLADDPGIIAPVSSRTVVAPNPAEAARLLPDLGDDVPPDELLSAAVDRLGCVVAVRSPDTYVAGPGTDVLLDRSGHPALGSSGSGDVFAGILAGLLARGAAPLDAALWAVHVHGRAGELVAASVGGLGLLARELLDEIPRVLAAVAGAGA